jgi:hypothetical protein
MAVEIDGQALAALFALDRRQHDVVNELAKEARRFGARVLAFEDLAQLCNLVAAIVRHFGMDKNGILILENGHRIIAWATFRLLSATL